MDSANAVIAMQPAEIYDSASPERNPLVPLDKAAAMLHSARELLGLAEERVLVAKERVSLAEQEKNGAQDQLDMARKVPALVLERVRDAEARLSEAKSQIKP